MLPRGSAECAPSPLQRGSGAPGAAPADAVVTIRRTSSLEVGPKPRWGGGSRHSSGGRSGSGGPHVLELHASSRAGAATADPAAAAAGAGSADAAPSSTARSGRAGTAAALPTGGSTDASHPKRSSGRRSSLLDSVAALAASLTGGGASRGSSRGGTPAGSRRGSGSTAGVLRRGPTRSFSAASNRVVPQESSSYGDGVAEAAAEQPL